MKINFVMWGAYLTGGTRTLFEIANRLVEKGHEVTIVSLGKKGEHSWFPLKASVTYVLPRSSKVLKIIRYGLRKIKLGIDYDLIGPLTRSISDCDINVATYCFTAFAVHRSGKGTPFYYIQHYEPLFFKDPYLRKVAEETYYLPLNKIVSSVWLRNLMKEKHGLNLPIVNPGVDLNVFYPREVSNSGKRIVLCAGSWKRWKGFPDALEAIKILFKNRFDVELVVYGASLPRCIDSEAPYKFVKNPSDDELAVLYSSADIYVCPSWYESPGLTPLEAMACGTPVIVTENVGNDYVVPEENALVVPPKDPQKMAEAILRILSDDCLAEKLRKEGFKTAKRFAWNKAAESFETIFEEALKQGE